MVAREMDLPTACPGAHMNEIEKLRFPFRRNVKHGAAARTRRLGSWRSEFIPAAPVRSIRSATGDLDDWNFCARFCGSDIAGIGRAWFSQGRFNAHGSALVHSLDRKTNECPLV